MSFTLSIGETPLTSLEFMFGITIFYIVLTMTLETYMKFRPPILGWTVKMAIINNTMYGLFSWVMLIYLTYTGWKSGLLASGTAMYCHAPSSLTIHYQIGLYLTYLSKLWEIWDLILVILLKGKTTLHFKIHHWTTLSIMWFALRDNVSFMLPLMMVNNLLHGFLYWHFAGINPYFIHAAVVLIPLQYAVGLGIGILVLLQRYWWQTPCDSVTAFAELYGIGMFIVYGILHQVEKIEKEKEE